MQKKLLHAITVVALSESEGDDSSGAPLPSEMCKKYLKAQIAEEFVSIPDEEVEGQEPVDAGTHQIQTDARQWVTEICEESRSLAMAEGDRDNIHFLPEIIPHIIRLGSYLPFWTGIMVPLFRSTSITATSAAVEAEFKNMKHGLFKHENLPILVDRFVARHLSFIEGNMRICFAKQKSENDVTDALTVIGRDPITTTSRIQTEEPNRKRNAHPGEESDAAVNSHPTDETAVENWRGLAVPPKKRKMSSYLSPCPEWLHADGSVGRKKVKVPLLINGSHQQPVKLGKWKVSVLNTCAFDAVFQSLCCSFCDSFSFEKIVSRNEYNSQFLQLVKTVTTQGVTKQVYSQRAELLRGIFKSVHLTSGALQIDAQCNVSTVIERTMKNVPSVHLMKQCSSQHCSLSTQVTREVQLVCTNTAVLQTSGMAHLETAVKEGLSLPDSPCLRPIQSPSQCPSALKKKDNGTGKALCSGNVTHSYSLGEAMWIDTELGSSCPEVVLLELPSSLVLQQKTFTLRAVIAFQRGLTLDALGHYVAYCRRAPCVWEMYDDLGTKMKAASENRKICPHAVFYTKQ
ncbi:uncharacterized protein V6R79_000278 [Siganus canaliculatus]